MKNIVKIFGLLSVIAVIPGAFATTSRVSMVSKASPRLPSIAGYIASRNVTTTSNAISYLSDPDCLNNYTDCIKGNEACGSGFEECTTNILLHAKMPVCLNVLSQCSAGGVKSLFGTNSLTAITTATTDSTGEVTGYTYPTADSALGQMVTAAQIANQLNKDQCVKKYTTCLKKDSVCGEDFELCTDNTEFKKQALACDSTLARCKNDGKTELFGDVSAANSLSPKTDSRLAEMISAGAQLAAVNTVSTCYKVADQCILNACSKNPTRCLEGKNKKQVAAADSTVDENSKSAAKSDDIAVELTSKSDVRKYIKGMCLDTIGTNKYCYATVAAEQTGSKLKFNTAVKSYTHLSEDEIEEVFEDIYATRMRDSLQKSIDDLADKFDKKTKDACVDTMLSCAMRSCGGGIGAVCFTQVNQTDGFSIIKSEASKKEITSACKAIVNTSPSCQYAALDSDSIYSYNYIDGDVFGGLFSESDPIGVIDTLNALLATSYNAAAIEELEKQCKNTALSCVRSMCGKDYVNCYRNRTDIVSGTYDTNTALDKSMNKMGGILDYNIVIGLCMNTVTEAKSCEEHLKIIAKGVSEDVNNVWTSSVTKTTDLKSSVDGKVVKLKRPFVTTETTSSYTSVRDAWLGANTTGASKTAAEIISGCTSSTPLSDTELTKCENRGEEACGYIDADGCVYDVEQKTSIAEYTLSESAKSLFQKVLVNVEKEVQAKYNAKLTKEQNVCYANNNGGVKGSNENGSTFMWVKLNSNKVPKNYAQKGLNTKQFKETGDLYGAFCRARITVTSDDKMIQDMLDGQSTAYFAVGDSFTCGSWIDDKTLTKISRKVAERELCKQGYGQYDKDGNCDTSKLSTKEKLAYAWGTVAPALAGLGIGVGLTESGTISGLLDKADAKMLGKQTGSSIKESCLNYVSKAYSAVNAQDVAAANTYATSALEMCRKLDKGKTKTTTNGKTTTTINGAGCPEDVPAAAGSNNANTNTVVTLGVTSTTVTNNQNEFKRSLIGMQTTVTGIAGADETEKTSTEYKSFGTAVKGAIAATEPIQGNAMAATAVELCKTIAGRVALLPEAACNYTEWVVNGTAPASTTTYTAGGSGTNLQDFKNYLGRIQGACQGANDVTASEADRNTAIRSVVPIMTTLGAGALGVGITASVIQSKKENIQNEEAQKWMDEVGDHIQCYLGADELGTYGDVVSIEIE